MSHIEQIPSRLRIASELTLLLVAVTLPFTVQAGFFSGLFSDEFVVEVVDNNELKNNPIEIALLSAEQNPNPLSGRGGAEIIIDENALVSTGPVGEDEIAKSGNGEIRVYTVREGDSLSEVADMFSVTPNTIMWANDLTGANDIRPGDSLVILPIVGVRHIVKSGDSLSTIAKKYEGNEEEILAYNQLDSASEISVGETIIIPGGAMHEKTVAKASSKSSSKNKSVGEGGSSSGFVHPAPGSVKSQGIHGYNAVDLAGGMGSSIRAAAAGEVIVAKGSGWNGGYGNYIVIKHNNGTQSLYAHLSSLNVGVGSYVSQGQVIGGMGNSGKSTGTHLHFEVRGGRNPF